MSRPRGVLSKCLIAAAIVTVLTLVRVKADAQEGANPAASPNVNGKIVGVWEGTTLASCSAMLPEDRCNAQQRVKLTVIEDDKGKLGGFYKCSFGTEDCYNMNETGKVTSADINGSLVTMQVMMRDGTACTFRGRPFNNKVDGSYECTTGGAVFERGRWVAQRTY
ncbi:MAG TPA: hypothetical protein VMT61_09640 [Candidatus Binataceae bacterium]|nr:hypothetical protein [Candidatus Binataceae bacterium]